MRRDHSARRGDRLHRSATTKNEQHLLVGDTEDAEPFAGFEQAQSELILVKANRTGKIAGVKAGFDDTVDVRRRHGHTLFQGRERFIAESIAGPSGAPMSTSWN